MDRKEYHKEYYQKKKEYISKQTKEYLEKNKKPKIYKIICHTTDLEYYGSTFKKLGRRLSGHKSDYKNGRKNLSVFRILQNNNYSIELVEEFDFEMDRSELLMYESLYIQNFECVNTQYKKLK